MRVEKCETYNLGIKYTIVNYIYNCEIYRNRFTTPINSVPVYTVIEKIIAWSILIP